MTAKQRYRGRPSSSAAKPGEKVTLSIRASAELKERLVSAASARGVPFSQEAELRLELSFREERRFQDQLQEVLEATYGRQLAAVLTVLGRTMKRAGERGSFESQRSPEAADDWLSDPYAFDQAVQTATAVLEAIRPDGDPTVLAHDKKPVSRAVDRFLGADVAAGTLDAIADPDGDKIPGGRPPELTDWAKRVQHALGPIADRIKLPSHRDPKKKGGKQ